MDPNAFNIEIIDDEDKIEISQDKKKRTSDIMSKYEYTAIVGIRAFELKMMARGTIPLKIDNDGVYDLVALAKKELHARLTPKKIKRILSDGSEEIWSIKDMNIRDY